MSGMCNGLFDYMETIETINDEDVDISLIKEIPLSFAKNNLLMPLRKENGFIMAAVADEKGLLALLDLSKRYGLRPQPISAQSGIVIDAINRYYGQVGTAREVMDGITGEDLSAVATEF